MRDLHRPRSAAWPRPSAVTANWPAALVFDGIGFFDVGVAVFSGRLEWLAERIVPCGARQALHAARLEITHPATRERLAIESPLPADMERVLTALRPR